MSTDKKYNRLGYTGLGTGMQNRLITGAYLSARADAPDYSWMNAVSSGIDTFKKEMDTKAANKKAEHEEIMSQIQGNMDEIYAAGGSMPEEYFDQAFTYTEQLRDKYVAAVESGDVKAQHKIKGQLNAFSTGIQNTKKSLEEGAELFNDDMLTTLTTSQTNIINSIKKGNAELDMESGVYKWRAVDKNGDPILDEKGQQKYYTEKDYDKALVMRDDVSIESYRSTSSSQVEGGDNWRNGKGGDFDEKIERDKNIKIVNESIKSVGSMQSMVHDDITGQGSFASTIEKHPQFEDYFNSMNTKDGLPNATAIGLYDRDGSNSVGYEDFISDEDYVRFEKWDTDGKKGISKEELEYAIRKDPNVLKNIQELVKPKLKDALLNSENKNYNEDITKDLLADFMTNRQKQMFYGKDGEKYKTLVPGVDGSVVIEKKGKLYIGKDQITDAEDYVERGGSLSHLDKAGWSWNSKKKEFVHNANWGALTIKKKAKY